jgi:hypothetical protein
LAEHGEVFRNWRDEGDAEQEEGVQADREQGGRRQALFGLLQDAGGRVFNAGTSMLAT